MSFWTVFFIGVGLSMDAFAVSLCKGLGMRRLSIKNTLIIALFFGGFQALMPLIGWLLGTQFESYVKAYDHWIAFGLLLFIGGKMLLDAIRGGEEAPDAGDGMNYRELLLMAVATSIDALAVGITLALSTVNIFSAIAVIGVTTFVLCVIGVLLGHAFGTKFQKGAQILGGAVLVLIGVKILLEHLGVIS